MSQAEVRLLSGTCELDEQGVLISGTPLGNIVIDLPNDEFPESLTYKSENFSKVFPGDGLRIPAYKRLEGKVNVSEATLKPYSETTTA